MEDVLKDELNKVHFFKLKSPKDTMQVAFVIDGRRYKKSEDVRHDIAEAGIYLVAHGLAAEMETVPIEPGMSISRFPSWQEYKRRLPRLEPKLFSRWKSWSESKNDLKTFLSGEKLNSLESAFEFALECHGDQKRPNDAPYVEHLLEVTEILVTGLIIRDENILVAGILHDVVEDTPCSLDDVRTRFGTQVAELVGWLTIQEQVDDNQSREKYFSRLQQAPSDALIIKLADRLSNVQRLDTHPNREKQKEYYDETVQKILPLAKSHPWFALQFKVWQEEFEPIYSSSAWQTFIKRIRKFSLW